MQCLAEVIFVVQALVSAFVITAAVVGFVAALAFCTDIDFTKFGGILAIVGWAFLVGIIIATFWVSHSCMQVARPIMPLTAC